MSAHLAQTPAPEEHVEHDDIHHTVEYALRAEYGLFERNAHEASVGENHRKPQHGTRHSVAERKRPRHQHKCRVCGKRDKRRPREALHHRRGEGALENVDDKARRHYKNEDVYDTLDRRLVHKTESPA